METAGTSLHVAITVIVIMYLIDRLLRSAANRSNEFMETNEEQKREREKGREKEGENEKDRTLKWS